jgi:hypothetical protein
MGVTAELEKLGDARLSKEIAAAIERGLSERRGDWRVTRIAGPVRIGKCESWLPMDLNGRKLWLALPENMNQRQSAD